MDSTAIKALQENIAAIDLNREVFKEVARDRPVVALPDDYVVNDLERYLQFRARERGTFATAHISSFVEHINGTNTGAPIFVDQDRMAAVAIYNMGDAEAPGHCDHRAQLALQKTAPFIALQQLAGNPQLDQRTIAEWVEDWHDHIQALDSDDQDIPIARLAATLRNIDIESARKVNSSEGDFSSSRSAMESIEAKSSIGSMPKVVIFTCEPYHGLGQQEFRFRISLLTGGDKLGFKARRIREEGDTEKTAEMFVQRLRNELADSDDDVNNPIYLGTFDPGK